MKKSTSTRAVVAALVHDNAHMLEEAKLLLLFDGLVFGVKENLANPADFEAPTQTVMMVEGAGVNISVGTTQILQMPLELLEVAIAKFEQEKDSRGKPQIIEDKGTYIFLIGSVAFCQAAAHYLGSREGGLCDSWAVHLIRQISPLRDRHLLWSAGNDPSDGRKYVLGDIIHLMAAKQEAA